MHLEQLGKRILHKEDGLVLHQLVVVGVLGGLLAIAHNDVQKHLLILGHWLALLGDELLCLLAQLLVHAQ